MSRPPKLLFPVAIDPVALLDRPAARDRQVHRAVVEVLRDHGVLTLGRVDSDALLDAIGRIEGDSRTLWVKLLSGLNDLNRIDRGVRAASVADTLLNLSNHVEIGAAVDLLIAGEEAAKQRGVNFTNGCLTIGETDVVLAATIDRSPTVGGAQGIGNYPPGTNRRVIGDEILRPAAARSGTVTVLDPHLLDHVLGSGRGRRRDHVEWLVAVFASSLPPGSTLAFIGDFPSGRGQRGELLTDELATSEIERAIGRALKGRSEPMTVRITLVRGPNPETKMSNRYLNFDCGFAFEVTHDISRLGSEKSPGPDYLTFRRLNAVETQALEGIAAGYTGYQTAPAVFQWESQTPLTGPR